jgi:hypothetical protein
MHMATSHMRIAGLLVLVLVLQGLWLKAFEHDQLAIRVRVYWV